MISYVCAYFYINTSSRLHCAWRDFSDAEAIRAAEKRLKEWTKEEYTVLDSLESIGSDSYG